MKATEQTCQQIERAIKKITEKFPKNEETMLMTDIHIRVNQDSGELLAFDDDDKEITRCVVEQWIGNTDDDFYSEAITVIRKCIERKKKIVEDMGILMPFSFVLEDEDKEHVGEIFVVDTDTAIFDPTLMKGLDEDLDNFLDNLLKDTSVD